MINPDDYQKKAQNEKRYFVNLKKFSALPDMTQWWASRYLAPRMSELFGYSGANKFYFEPLVRAASNKSTVLAISLGAGDGEVELGLARQLRGVGIGNVKILGFEITEGLVDRANNCAEQEGLAHIVEFQVADLNDRFGVSECDFIIANQILHHLVDLEKIFDNSWEALSDDGVLMTRDMIGKNGHQAWSEAKFYVDSIWENMPDRYKHDCRKNIFCDVFPNTDFSTSGFEGIRSQDVLPLLNERFGYSAFYAFGGIVERFINRSFGHSYSRENADDRLFVSNLQMINDILLDLGQIKPTQMCAYFTKNMQRGVHWNERSPENSVRET